MRKSAKVLFYSYFYQRDFTQPILVFEMNFVHLEPKNIFDVKKVKKY